MVVVHSWVLYISYPYNIPFTPFSYTKFAIFGETESLGYNNLMRQWLEDILLNRLVGEYLIWGKGIVANKE